MTPGKMKTIRTKAGLSQRELARQVGCTFQHMSRMENGHRPITKPYELAMRYVCERKFREKPMAENVRIKLEEIAREMGWL